MSVPSQAHLNHQQQKFYIPKSNISSNDKELKQMRKNMLKQQYDNQILKHQQQNFRNGNNPEYYSNSRVHQFLNNHINDTQKIQRNLKTMLAQQYKQEMKRKELLKRQQRQDKLRNQVVQNQRVRNLQSEQFNYAYNSNNQYKKQVLKDLEQRQILKNHRKQQQSEQNNYFRRHYSQPKFGGSDKRKSFQQYYAALHEHRKAIQDDFIQRTSKIDKQRQIEKQMHVNNAIYEKQMKVQRDIQKQFLAQEKTKQNLRDSLVRQIEQKQRHKKEEKFNRRNEPYMLDEFKKAHHPIYNPVDFRITHDNRYIINEIQGRGQEKRMSDLARSGSQALLS